MGEPTSVSTSAVWVVLAKQRFASLFLLFSFASGIKRCGGLTRRIFLQLGHVIGGKFCVGSVANHKCHRKVPCFSSCPTYLVMGMFPLDHALLSSLLPIFCSVFSIGVVDGEALQVQTTLKTSHQKSCNFSGAPIWAQQTSKAFLFAAPRLISRDAKICHRQVRMSQTLRHSQYSVGMIEKGSTSLHIGNDAVTVSSRRC
jgi:hypothetical protein